MYKVTKKVKEDLEEQQKKEEEEVEIKRKEWKYMKVWEQEAKSFNREKKKRVGVKTFKCQDCHPLHVIDKEAVNV